MNKPPIFIELALWYHTRAEDHPSVSLTHGAPAYNETANELVSLGLLEMDPIGTKLLKPTDGLAVYVEALCNVPTPVKCWVIPYER